MIHRAVPYLRRKRLLLDTCFFFESLRRYIVLEHHILRQFAVVKLFNSILRCFAFEIFVLRYWDFRKLLQLRLIRCPTGRLVIEVVFKREV